MHCASCDQLCDYCLPTLPDHKIQLDLPMYFMPPGTKCVSAAIADGGPEPFKINTYYAEWAPIPLM
jgi:hypothetical protein